ncbi:MAG: TetR/AcrR family transcriptional regulator [Pseudomonadales bacterium]|nr:TetR/AcrR family transcriptional regulator [Pseudomonadales bacterium]
MSKQPRKEFLLETAYRLFNEQGYHATGIDMILAASGVSKATLYKYFRTKDELILEVLRRRHDEFDAVVDSYIQNYLNNNGEGASAHRVVLVIFDALNDWINSEQFFGCNFINASAEYGAKDDPIHRFAAVHKESLRDKVKTLLTGLKNSQREMLADQLLMLIDGAIVAAQVRGDSKSALTAKKAATALIAPYT